MADADWRKLEERTYKEGGGVWFHKETGEQIYVECSFYPRTRLRLRGTNEPITREELERNYERLRL